MKKAFIGRGGFKLSDSGGRTVIDKMYDLENNGDAEFSGTDRPEWSQGMVCVERETTNRIDDPDQCGDDTTAWSHTAITLAVAATPYLNFDAWEIGSSATTGRAAQTLTAQFTGSEETSYIIVERGTANRCALAIRDLTAGQYVGIFEYNFSTEGFSASSEQVGSVSIHEAISLGAGPNGGEVVLLRVTFAGTLGNDYGFWIFPDRNGNSDTTIIHFAQHEESPYPTLPVDGTRLAPAAVLEGWLPETGCVAGRVDMVRHDGSSQNIFGSGSMAATTRSDLRITENNFYLRIGGSDGGVISASNPFAGWGDLQRKKFSWAVSYNEGSLHLALHDDTSLHLYSAPHQINVLVQDTTLGGTAQGNYLSSTYFKSLHRDTIVRTTEAEFEALFDSLP